MSGNNNIGGGRGDSGRAAEVAAEARKGFDASLTPVDGAGAAEVVHPSSSGSALPRSPAAGVRIRVNVTAEDLSLRGGALYSAVRRALGAAGLSTSRFSPQVGLSVFFFRGQIYIVPENFIPALQAAEQGKAAEPFSFDIDVAMNRSL